MKKGERKKRSEENEEKRQENWGGAVAGAAGERQRPEQPSHREASRQIQETL